MSTRNQFMAAKIDPEKVAEILRDCADKYILPRYNALEQHEIESKTSQNDLVTVADHETEEALIAILSKEYPGSLVIGEESISKGTKSLSALAKIDELVWVIDPVDGTYNFVHGKDKFGMILACVFNGDVVHSWIYDVPGKNMAIAEKGSGAFYNGTAMSTSAVKDYNSLIGHAGKKYFPQSMQSHIDKSASDVSKLYTIGCACHEYLNLARGHVDFALYTNTRPWDHLAGILMVQEAGGVAAKWNGKAYRPTDDKKSLLIASEKSVWNQIHAKFINPFVPLTTKTKFRPEK